MAHKQEHCELGRLLSDEEIPRLQALLIQQGITLPESELIAQVKKGSSNDKCPFRVTIGEGTDFCVDHCYISKKLGSLATKLSE